MGRQLSSWLATEGQKTLAITRIMLSQLGQGQNVGQIIRHYWQRLSGFCASASAIQLLAAAGDAAARSSFEIFPLKQILFNHLWDARFAVRLDNCCQSTFPLSLFENVCMRVRASACESECVWERGCVCACSLKARRASTSHHRMRAFAFRHKNNRLPEYLSPNHRVCELLLFPRSRKKIKADT